MLRIRLQRTGKKKQAHFRVVLQEHTWKTKGGFIEQLGTYDPHAKKLDVDRERIEHWISKGAQITPTVNNLMVNYKIWDRAKLESWKPKVKEGAEGTEAAPAAPAADEAPVAERPATEPETAPAAEQAAA